MLNNYMIKNNVHIIITSGYLRVLDRIVLMLFFFCSLQLNKRCSANICVYCKCFWYLTIINPFTVNFICWKLRFQFCTGVGNKIK